MPILLVEDDERLADVLCRGLDEEGYDIAWAGDGTSGLTMALDDAYDCILLDRMLPGMDGLSLCRELRRRGRGDPVIMITVKDATEDKVEGLEAGADDYVVKPFSFKELVARIQAQVRRHRVFSLKALQYRDLVLDPHSRSARRQGRRIELTPKEYDLLEYFVRNAERIVTLPELIENVWGLAFDPRTNVLNVYLHHLRGKIDRDFDKDLIHTVRGQGFLFGEKS